MPGTTKVIYKPDPQSTDEYMIIVETDEYKKYKAGDTYLYRSCKHRPIIQFLVVFNSHKDDDVIQQILEKGEAQATDGVATPGGVAQINVSRGSNNTAGGGR
ncbi:SBDS domain-containing protein [Mycena kentingensis (nom. inval.)]|nr:SBDS domain-containing protein [Mycena kentingensis (nom. inval.)]